MALCLPGLAGLAGGCHNLWDCPILQPMTGGNIPAPLPFEGETYDVVGYRKGIRFYVVKYDEGLYRGGDIRSEQAAATLANEFRIKTVISVTPTEKERRFARRHNWNLVEIPFSFYDVTEHDFEAFEAAMDKYPGPYYVHCFGGEVRAASLLADYRIQKQGWSYDKAMDEYWRLRNNPWDSLTLVGIIKKRAEGR
jgi:protein tyrosine phosphatase (PTP) superfamily phosphohydrolase (DUF442 family)